MNKASLSRWKKFWDNAKPDQQIWIQLQVVDNQNKIDKMRSYYFAGIVRPIAEHTANDETSVHEYLKNKYLWRLVPDTNSKSGMAREIISLADIKTVLEFQRFINLCEVEMAELLELPD